MSIKAYKGFVVPFPCKKDWKWMLTEDLSGCYNINPEGEENCRHVDCHDCVYFNTEARAEYYKSCFPERPKLTVEIFDRPDCPEWAEWAAADGRGAAYWYSAQPDLIRNNPITWCPQFGTMLRKIEGTLYEGSNKPIFRAHNLSSCSTCKNYEPKDSPDREMIPVYEFDWYTQWKYSPSEDTYYYIENLSKNRARELKTGELVNEIPADVIVVIPRDPGPATLTSTAVKYVPTGNYYVIQKVEGDGSRIYVKDMDWEKSEFYKNFIDKYGRPVCHFERVAK